MELSGLHQRVVVASPFKQHVQLSDVCCEQFDGVEVASLFQPQFVYSLLLGVTYKKRGLENDPVKRLSRSWISEMRVPNVTAEEVKALILFVKTH